MTELLPRPIPPGFQADRLGIADVAVCLYGNRKDGFAFLLSDRVGCVEVHGKGSYWKCDWHKVDTCETRFDAVTEAVRYCQPDAIVRVFETDGSAPHIAQAHEIVQVMMA